MPSLQLPIIALIAYCWRCSVLYCILGHIQWYAQAYEQSLQATCFFKFRFLKVFFSSYLWPVFFFRVSVLMSFLSVVLVVSSLIVCTGAVDCPDRIWKMCEVKCIMLSASYSPVLNFVKQNTKRWINIWPLSWGTISPWDRPSVIRKNLLQFILM